MNLSLLMKLADWLVNDKGELEKILNKRIKSLDGSRIHYHGKSSIGSRIKWAIDKSKCSSMHVVGNGSTVYLWRDPWAGDSGDFAIVVLLEGVNRKGLHPKVDVFIRNGRWNFLDSVVQLFGNPFKP